MLYFRKLIPTDLAAYKAHLLRLSTDDRYSRFSGLASDETIAAHVRRIDWRCAVILGVFDNGRLCGAAELRSDPVLMPEHGEIALSLEKTWQNSGLGSVLTERLVFIARNHGLKELQVFCLTSNRRMQRIVSKMGGTVEFEGSEALARIPLDRATPATVLREWLGETVGAVYLPADRAAA